jgi:hypothetical protein
MGGNSNDNEPAPVTRALSYESPKDREPVPVARNPLAIRLVAAAFVPISIVVAVDLFFFRNPFDRGGMGTPMAAKILSLIGLGFCLFIAITPRR